MKTNTPLITLLTGAALGVTLLVASMLATPQAPARSSGPGRSEPWRGGLERVLRACQHC
jgi:hypothetical protein